ncbi:MAG: CDP-alcohol phosphatidyltransferase family protein [Monoglobaceae bacterium]
MQYKFTKKDILTIPNAMSFFRLLLIPVIIWLYCGEENYLWATVVTALSAVTDIVDGKIARRFSMVSDFGKVLDPVADKLTQAALLFCLTSRYSWMWALLILFVVKELFMILLGYIVIYFHDTVNSAKWYGKCCTVILETVMMYLILFTKTSEAVANNLILLCCIAILFSFAMYLRFYLKLLKNDLSKLLVHKSWRIIWRCLFVCVWGGFFLFCFFHKEMISVDGIIQYTPKSPVMASFIILLLFVIKSLSIVIYSGILYAATGLLFPLPYAIFLNICGTVIMVSVPYFIGKAVGTPVTQKITEKYSKVAMLQTIRNRNEFLFSFFTRIINVLPCDIVSLYMGAIRMNYRKYLLGCVLGFLPPVITFPIMGMSITDIHSPQFIIAASIEIIFAVGSIALTLIIGKKTMKESAQKSKENTEAKS